MILRCVALLAALAAGLTVNAAPAWAQGKKSDSVVKAKATADKPADGKQVVTITLDIDSKYHIYANPVENEDLEATQTVVSVTGKTKPESVKVDYPPGKLVVDTVGNFKEYTGTVTIKATVQRAKGDTEPLTVSIKVQACSKTGCLLPATIKLTVP